MAVVLAAWQPPVTCLTWTMRLPAESYDGKLGVVVLNPGNITVGQSDSGSLVRCWLYV